MSRSRRQKKLAHEGDPRTTKDPKLRELLNQAQQLWDFLRQWQTFLADKEAGNLTAARSKLDYFMGSERDFSDFIPRSELLARLAALEKETDSMRKDPKKADIEARQLLARIVAETPALESITAVIDQIERLANTNEPAIANKAMTVVSFLRSLNRTYDEVKRGQASRIILPTLVSSSGFETEEFVSGYRSQLVMFALPRILGLPDDRASQKDENASSYLQRTLERARKEEDWPLVGRVLEAAQTLNLGAIATINDSTALRSFLAGLNQEKARQYALAVSSFQAALKTGSQVISPEMIGEHLEKIRSISPSEFEKGIQLTLTPPAPTTPRPSGRYIYDPSTGSGVYLPAGSESVSPPSSKAASPPSVAVPAKATPAPSPSPSPP